MSISRKTTHSLQVSKGEAVISSKPLASNGSISYRYLVLLGTWHTSLAFPRSP